MGSSGPFWQKWWFWLIAAAVVIALPFSIKYAENHIAADVVVVDPPRKGCDAACLDTIVKMAPHRVVYVSCDSATLARDLKYLCGEGYEVEKVRCVDMFGWSGHIECVAALRRRGK